MDKNNTTVRPGRRPTKRRLVQLYAALLYNANLKGFISGNLYTGNTKAVCVPGLNCYSCPGAVGACPLGSLQNALSASGHRMGWYVFGILLLFGITLGRTICGWLCPLGMIQELLHKIPTPKIGKNKITRALSWLKYVVLAVMVIAIPLYYGLAKGLPMPAFCKFICPAGTSEGAIALLSNPNNQDMFHMLGIVFTRKFVILMAVGLACIFCYRSFCRFICPLGALYSVFNRFALVGVKVDESRCNHCGACVRKCQMDVHHVNDRECISCGACMNSCAQGAISIKCGSVTLKGPEVGPNADPAPVQEKRRRNSRIAWIVALAVLAGALLYFNLPGSSAGERTDAVDVNAGNADAGTAAGENTLGGSGENGGGEETLTEGANGAVPEEAVTEAANAAAPETTAADVPVGSEVGQRLEDFTCTLRDGSTFHLADEKGKIVFINQWATYCVPCVSELPEFEKLAEENPDIVILAAHNPLEAKPTAEEFILEHGWDSWKVKFTVDTPEVNIIPKIGGNNTMPRTVVLNKEGVIVYNEQRSVTYEMLVSMLKMAGE